jgi:hypothetical protein
MWRDYMYGCRVVGNHLRDFIEGLLVEYKVDLTLAGQGQCREHMIKVGSHLTHLRQHQHWVAAKVEPIPHLAPASLKYEYAGTQQTSDEVRDLCCTCMPYHNASSASPVTTCLPCACRSRAHLLPHV